MCEITKRIKSEEAGMCTYIVDTHPDQGCKHIQQPTHTQETHRTRHHRLCVNLLTVVVKVKLLI